MVFGRVGVNRKGSDMSDQELNTRQLGKMVEAMCEVAKENGVTMVVGNPLTVQNLVKDAHLNATQKGFHDVEKTFGDTIALIHTEVSEAYEAYRQSLPPVIVKDGKPEGWAVELADVVIRIADAFGLHNLNLEEILISKMEYNKTRPHMHGGKRV